MCICRRPVILGLVFSRVLQGTGPPGRVISPLAGVWCEGYASASGASWTDAREVAAPFAQTAPVRVVPLSDAWAQRRFAICYRDEQALSPAAQLLVQHLARASAKEAPEPLA